MRRLFVLALFALAPPLGAQSAAKVVTPGMSRAKVVAVMGEPATVRSVAEFTYMFYQNACAKRCGMNDLVVLHADSVVDAIFRSPGRQYTGTSSSPAPISSQRAARPATATKPAAASSPATRMKPPAEANDARPSIPISKPTLYPASPVTPATRAP
ncbi:MAG: hypothetical protein ABI601_11680 [bacterium]